MAQYSIKYGQHTDMRSMLLKPRLADGQLYRNQLIRAFTAEFGYVKKTYFRLFMAPVVISPNYLISAQYSSD